MNLYTDADLADVFGVTERRIAEWRRQFGWPHVKTGRQVRYTDAQLEQIVASHSNAGEKRDRFSVKVAGQTKRSASRRRSA